MSATNRNDDTGGSRGVMPSGLLIALAILVLPLPHATRAEGVVWVPERSIVRLDTEGFVDRLLVPPGTRVT